MILAGIPLQVFTSSMRLCHPQAGIERGEERGGVSPDHHYVRGSMAVVERKEKKRKKEKEREWVDVFSDLVRSLRKEENSMTLSRLSTLSC